MFLQKGGPYLAIYLWGFMFVLSILMMTLYPILIAPLFNKFTPVSIYSLHLAARVISFSSLTAFRFPPHTPPPPPPPFFFLLLLDVIDFHFSDWHYVPLFLYQLIMVFNVEQLPEGELREKIEKLAASLKFPLKKLFVVDGSTRSSHSNVSHQFIIVF